MIFKNFSIIKLQNKNNLTGGSNLWFFLLPSLFLFMACASPKNMNQFESIIGSKSKSQEQALSEFVEGIIIPQILEEVEEEEEKRIIRDIHFKYPAHKGYLHAKAKRNNNIKIIEISTRFLLLLELISRSRLLSWYKANNGETEWSELMEKYFVYMAEEIANNQQKIETILTFANKTKDDISDFEAWTRRDIILYKSLKHSLMWVVAHEIAHHLLDHFDSDSPVERPKKEDMADEWATNIVKGVISDELTSNNAKEMINAVWARKIVERGISGESAREIFKKGEGISIVPIFDVLSLFILFDGGYIEDDKYRTHPWSGCRLQKLINADRKDAIKIFESEEYLSWLHEQFPKTKLSPQGFKNLNIVDESSLNYFSKLLIKKFKCEDLGKNLNK